MCFMFVALVGYPSTNCMTLNGGGFNAPCVCISISLGGFSLFCWGYVLFFALRSWQLGPGLNLTRAFSHKISRTSWLVVCAQMCLAFLTLLDTCIYAIAKVGPEPNVPEIIAFICRNVSVYPSIVLAMFFALTCDHVRRHAKFIRSQVSAMGKLRVSLSVNDDEGGVEEEGLIEEDEPLPCSASRQDLSDRLHSLKRELLCLKNRFMVYVAVQNMTMFVYTVFKVFVLWVEVDDLFSVDNLAFLEGVISVGYLVLINMTTFTINFAGAEVTTAVQEIYYAALECSSPCLNGAKALSTNPNLALSLFGFQLTKNNVIRMVYFVASGSYIFLQVAIRYAL